MMKRAQKVGKKHKKSNETSKQIIKLIILLVVLIILTTIIILLSGLERPINEHTASYISFNNQNTTDMLKITNLKKLADKKGISQDNSNYLDINIEGDKNAKYEIVLYSISNNIDLKYINFCLLDKDTILIKAKLSETDDSSDGGKVIYQSKIKNNNLVLRMWIAEDYQKKVQDNAFEVRIKPR